MKSTGLFGKNSGRVGGVVYSNYRGEQVVRSYQPQVRNPNSPGQVAQRAKFKLVSQVGAALGSEISLSFVSQVSKETSRNAFVKAMLKKTTYSSNEASLPIEEIKLTSSKIPGFRTLSASVQSISGSISEEFSSDSRVRIVIIGYNEGGEIMPIRSLEPQISEDEDNVRRFEVQVSTIGLPAGYSHFRMLAYVYKIDRSSGTTYQDYEVLAGEATLTEIIRLYAGKLKYSATENILLSQSV